jgi:hypothetical protein
MRLTISRSRRPRSDGIAAILLVSILAGCTTPQQSIKLTESTATAFDSAAFADAIGVATQRMHDHWQSGFSVGQVRGNREAYTPQLYEMLVRDMSDPGGVGYLNANPFTDAQDDVGPFRFEDVRQSGDTMMVRFSRGETPAERRHVQQLDRCNSAFVDRAFA